MPGAGRKRTPEAGSGRKLPKRKERPGI